LLIQSMASFAPGNGVSSGSGSVLPSDQTAQLVLASHPT
jgi:hypothetical protein